MEETSLPKTELLSGYITIVTIVLGIVCFSTFSYVDDNIDNLQNAILEFSEKSSLELVYLGASILFLVSMVGMSALYLLVFRFYNPVLGSFVSFGFFASAVSMIISSSAALSFYQLLGDFLLSTDYQSDMVAINMMSIFQLKMKSLMIAGTFFGLSMVFLSIVSYISSVMPLIVSLFNSITGAALVYVTWQIQSPLIIRLSIIFAAVSMLLAGIYLVIHSKKIKFQ
mgnify:CR=1 FL=1